MILRRTTWGAIPWDGTLGGMRQCLDRLVGVGAPAEAQLVIGPVSHTGPQVTAFVLSEQQEEIEG